MDKTVQDHIAVGLFRRTQVQLQTIETSVGPEASYGSPIEFALAAAFHLVECLDRPGFEFQARFGFDDEACKGYMNWGFPSDQSPDFGGAIFPQVSISKYTADFFVIYRTAGSKKVHGLVVECDGHDFHERTKEQAAHDKVRDRELQALGYKVLRFTGSEVWRDPVGCAVEVLALVCGEQGEASLAERAKPQGEAVAA